MDETLIEKVELGNGLTLTIEDRSRKISADAWQVIVEAKVPVAVEPGLFSDETLDTIPMEDILKKVGDQVVYEYRTERNFIMDTDKEDVVGELVATFRASLMPYLSKPDFPAKLVLKEYRKM